MEQGDGFSMPVEWRPEISDDEIREAKHSWLAARDGVTEVTPERVAVLFEYFRTLISLQAQQIAEEFRAQHHAA